MTFYGFDKHGAVLATANLEGKPHFKTSSKCPNIAGCFSHAAMLAESDWKIDSGTLEACAPASESAPCASLRNTRATSKERGQIRVDKRSVVDSRQIGRRFEARENCVGDFASRHTFLTVTRGNI